MKPENVRNNNECDTEFVFGILSLF